MARTEPHGEWTNQQARVVTRLLDQTVAHSDFHWMLNLMAERAKEIGGVTGGQDEKSAKSWYRLASDLKSVAEGFPP